MMAIDLEGVINYLLLGWRDIRKRPRETKRERGGSRDRAKTILRRVGESEGI